ncbi:MAG TPA: type IV pilus assembly protein PilM [Clostridiales bacterium]|nr:type IV pilus assembly protein PilM [Clostridiales bacterium]
MMQNLICLDFGSQNIHMVCGRYNKGNIEVRNAASMRIPDGVFKDGKIDDFTKMKDCVRAIISENRIKEKNAVATIQSTSIITRDIVLPAADRQKLDGMVKYEIEQYLPIVATEYVIEYSVIGETVEGGVKKYKVQVAAMPKNMVENFLNLLKESGLKPTALDIHSNAVSKLFTQNTAINVANLDSKQTSALIDLGYRSINIHILANGKLAFSRIINLGAREIDYEISVACNMTLEEAEEKKIRDAELDPKGYMEIISDPFNDVIRAQVDTWLSEIQKIFQYYISRMTGNTIDRIYLFGGSSQLKGLKKYIELSLNLRTDTIDSLNIVKLGRNIKDFNPRTYINALGGLIRYE